MRLTCSEFLCMVQGRETHVDGSADSKTPPHTQHEPTCASLPDVTTHTSAFPCSPKDVDLTADTTGRRAKSTAGMVQSAGALLCTEFAGHEASPPFGTRVAARLRSVWPHSTFVRQQDMRKLCRRIAPMAGGCVVTWLEVRRVSDHWWPLIRNGKFDQVGETALLRN